MKHIYTSIDLGSDSVKVVVCELYQNKLNLLAASSSKSKGIKKGVIVDIDAASESVLKTLAEIESMLGFKIKEVVTSVPSYYASFTPIQGKIEIAGDVVDSDDITNVMTSAFKTKQIQDKEMVTIIPIDFNLDGVTEIKDPKGKEGKILGIRAVMVSVPKKNIYSVVGLLERLNLEVIDITIGSIADMCTYKTKDNSKKVGAVVNIGSDTTNVSIYNKSIVVKNSVIDLGGKNIDNDISYIYKLLPNDAVKIKEKFALASSKYASTNDYYEVTDKLGDIRRISQKEISELVMSRIEEILILVRKEINLLTKHDVDYIILTGGTSSMSNFDLVAENVLGQLPVVGSIKIPGVRNNKYSIAIGNIVYFINRMKLKGIEYTMVGEDEQDSLSPDHKGLLNISSESMLGKVFGYFFNE